jgi:hypothetical protein
MRGKRVLVALAAAGVFGLAPVASAATTASVGGAELTVTGSAAADTITVTLPGDALAPPTVDTQYEVTDPAGVTPGGGCVQGTMPDPADDTDPATPPLPPVNDPNKVHCDRGAAPRPAFNDFIVTISGGGGNDTIRSVAPLTVGDAVSTGDRSFISGGAGDDTISGSENDDTISGDAGNDVIDGDGGLDILSGGTVPVIADPAAPTLKVADVDYSAGGINTVGASGNDSVFGGGGADIITDGDNTTETSDVLSGFKCAPALVIGGVPCPVTSLQNVDVPEEDFDELYWGHRTSAQAVTVDTQVPTATQGATGENETTIGMRGVYGSAGNDVLMGHDADVGNILSGNAGNDSLDGRGGNDELLGGDGADTILGGDGGDIINPGGHIVLPAPVPNATTMTSDGADTIDGGADGATATDGVDSITYAGRSDNLTLNLKVTTGWGAAGENDTVTGVENLTGGHGADTITASVLPSVIESDPTAPEAPHAGEPVLPFPPPGGYYGNDTIHVRNGAADTVDCGGDAADPDSDTVIGDRTPADTIAANCEVVDLPPPPPPPPPAASTGGGAGGNTGNSAGSGAGGSSPVTGTAAAQVKISGGRSAGRVRVKANGSFTLSKIVITCPSGGKNCSVRTVVGAGSARLASSSYTLKSARKGAARGKLSKKGLKRLRQRRSIKTSVTVRVVRNGKTTTKKVTVTLLAAKKAKKAA